MNQNFHTIALIFLLVSFTTISKYPARELALKQGEVYVKISSMESQESITKMKGFDSFNKLMDLEENNSCEGTVDEEECFRRRDMLEAHLDYIYTQQHKP